MESGNVFDDIDYEDRFMDRYTWRIPIPSEAYEQVLFHPFLNGRVVILSKTAVNQD